MINLEAISQELKTSKSDDKKLWVSVEIKIAYKEPPSSTSEAMDRDREQVEWDIKADKFCKAIEERLND